MKKLFLFSVMFLMSVGVFAQKLPIDLGVKFGWNSSKVSTSNLSTNLSDYSPTNNSGYLVGAFARLYLKKIFIQPEIYYAVKKGETSFAYDDGNTNENFDYKLKVKSFDIPILLGYQLMDLKLLKINAITGPVMVINANSEASVPAEIADGVKDPKGVDWAYQLGLGVDIAMFTVDARYEWGLSNIRSGNLGDISFDQKSNMFTFSVGWKFL